MRRFLGDFTRWVEPKCCWARVSKYVLNIWKFVNWIKISWLCFHGYTLCSKRARCERSVQHAEHSWRGTHEKFQSKLTSLHPRWQARTQSFQLSKSGCGGWGIFIQTDLIQQRECVLCSLLPFQYLLLFTLCRDVEQEKMKECKWMT